MEQLPEFAKLAQELAAANDTHVILLNNRIDDTALKAVRAIIRRDSRVLLIVTTYGGDPHVAYRIGRALQRNYRTVSVLVPSLCKSAGTLIAAAGHEIVMSDVGELGPLDVLLPKPEEILDYASTSVLNDAIRALLAAARDAFRDQLIDLNVGGTLPASIAAPIASQMTATLFGNVFAKLDPHRIGEVTRGSQIGSEYLSRLGRRSKNITDENARRLVGGYPDHGFVIDREEACELFANVRQPSELEQRLLQALGPLASDPDASEKSGKILVLSLTTPMSTAAADGDILTPEDASDEDAQPDQYRDGQSAHEADAPSEDEGVTNDAGGSGSFASGSEEE